MTGSAENLTGVRIHPPLLTLVHLLAAFVLGWLVPLPLVLGMVWGLILAPLLILLTNRLAIEYEEAYLAKQFGQEYLEFTSRVGRWL